jgi:hypothetical protein
MGTFLFTPHGADHGWGRGYTKKERNRPQDYDLGDVVSAYTIKPLKGTQTSFTFSKPSTRRLSHDILYAVAYRSGPQSKYVQQVMTRNPITVKT